MMRDGFRTMALPDTVTRARLRAEALANDDGDLPASQRSSRAQILRDRTLNVGDTVTLIDGLQVTVLAAGRGLDTFQGGWVDENGAACRGTFFSNQITTVQAAP